MAIPAIDPTVRPTWQPTGLTIAAGAKHRDVNISWDTPPDGSNVTGFALYRKWQGESNTPHLCLYWSTKDSEFITSYRDTHVAAYDDAGNKNKYVYKVYPLNAAVPQNLSAPGGCDDYRPGDMQPQASVTATLTLSTDIFPNSDDDLEYASPPGPRWTHPGDQVPRLPQRYFNHHSQMGRRGKRPRLQGQVAGDQ